MKHEPRQAIYIEKPQLTAWVGWYVGWDRISGDLQGGTNSVSQVDGVSDMAPACWLCESVEGGFRNGTMASAGLDARNFSFFLYSTDAFQAATMVLVLRGSESE